MTTCNHPKDPYEAIGSHLRVTGGHFRDCECGVKVPYYKPYENYGKSIPYFFHK